jgi:hypothetical protein
MEKKKSHLLCLSQCMEISIATTITIGGLISGNECKNI